MSFIRKIYNIIAHKQERLDKIEKLEEKLSEKFNGDLDLAEKQIKNGNWTLLTKTELDEIRNKPVLQASLNE